MKESIKVASRLIDPLDFLPLRVAQALRYQGYFDTLSKIRAATDNELLRTPRFGRKALAQVKEWLRWCDSHPELTKEWPSWD